MREGVDIIKYSKCILFSSSLLIIASTIVAFLVPFNKSIQFKGGSTVHIEMHSNHSIDDLALPKNTKISSANSRYDISFAQSINQETKKSIEQHATIHSTSTIAPTITKSLLYKSLMAILFSMIAIFVYIFLRFNIYYSIGTITTILHDVILIVAFIKIFNIELNITIIAAILTIIGYSVNDTVIIYDKIRSLLTSKSNIKQTLNQAIKLTLSRTVGTSMSTALAIFPALLLTTGSIKDFCFVIMFGVIVGTFSSIAVSALILLPFQKKIFEILKIKSEIKTH